MHLRRWQQGNRCWERCRDWWIWNFRQPTSRRRTSLCHLRFWVWEAWRRLAKQDHLLCLVSYCAFCFLQYSLQILAQWCSCCLQSPLSVLQQPSWVTWRLEKIMTLHGTLKNNNRKVLTPTYHPSFYFRTPDTAKVRSKMLYASSKDALRRNLVGIAIEVQGTDLSEVRHLHTTGVSKGLAVPLQLRSPSHSFPSSLLFIGWRGSCSREGTSIKLIEGHNYDFSSSFLPIICSAIKTSVSPFYDHRRDKIWMILLYWNVDITIDVWSVRKQIRWWRWHDKIAFLLSVYDTSRWAFDNRKKYSLDFLIPNSFANLLLFALLFLLSKTLLLLMWQYH